MRRPIKQFYVIYPQYIEDRLNLKESSMRVELIKEIKRCRAFDACEPIEFDFDGNREIFCIEVIAQTVRGCESRVFQLTERLARITDKPYRFLSLSNVYKDVSLFV